MRTPNHRRPPLTRSRAWKRRQGVIVVTMLALACSRPESGSLVRRLGPRSSQPVTVNGERREVVALEGTASRIDTSLDAGCTIDIGYAHVGRSGALKFDVVLTRGESELSDTRRIGVGRAGGDWTDLRLEAPGGGATGLVLRIEGRSSKQGVWSRPIATCPDERYRRDLENVLLVSLDTLRADRLGVYGNEHDLTPNLDRFANAGALFEQAYAQFPSTLYSHGSLFTGEYPSKLFRGFELSAPDAWLPAGTDTLASVFADRGYATAAFTEGGFVSSAFGFAAGFDSYYAGTDTDTRDGMPETFRRGVKWLARRPQAPFFLFLHTYEVHTPYSPDPAVLEEVAAARNRRYEGRFGSGTPGRLQLALAGLEVELSKDDEKQLELLYDAEVRMLDAAVGELLDHVARLGLADSTLIVFFSDHGEAFFERGVWGHGTSLHTEETRVPFLLRLPGIVPAGTKIKQPVGLIDLGPTVLELAGAADTEPLGSGTSRAGSVLDDSTEPGAPVFSELAYSESLCRVLPDRKYARCPSDVVALRDEDRTYIQSDALDLELLFEAASDPNERLNVAPDQPDVAARYRELVGAFRNRFREPTERAEKGEGESLDEPTRHKLRALGYLD